jgi:hypothetical protein
MEVKEMFKMTSSDGFTVTGLNIEGVRKTLAYDGITGVYLTTRVLSNGPKVFGGWTVVAM